MSVADQRGSWLCYTKLLKFLLVSADTPVKLLKFLLVSAYTLVEIEGDLTLMILCV